MQIINSEIIKQVIQADGRIDVTERHFFSDGHTQEFNYLAEPSLDLQTVANFRADNINAELASREAALAAATKYEIPFTQLEIMRKLTPAEWAAFQSSTDQNIAFFRAAFDKATVIYRNDPLTQAGFNALVAAGILTAGRVAEVLA